MFLLFFYFFYVFSSFFLFYYYYVLYMYLSAQGLDWDRRRGARPTLDSKLYFICTIYYLSLYIYIYILHILYVVHIYIYIYIYIYYILYTCIYIYIYIYVVAEARGRSMDVLWHGRGRHRPSRAGRPVSFFFFLTQRVFPTSSWCFCSGGGQVILQRL